eukprot:773641-Amphidinium_carterae.1
MKLEWFLKLSSRDQMLGNISVSARLAGMEPRIRLKQKMSALCGEPSSRKLGWFVDAEKYKRFLSPPLPPTLCKRDSKGTCYADR